MDDDDDDDDRVLKREPQDQNFLIHLFSILHIVILLYSLNMQDYKTSNQFSGVRIFGIPLSHMAAYLVVNIY